jgi:hypothetical protein
MTQFMNINPPSGKGVHLFHKYKTESLHTGVSNKFIPFPEDILLAPLTQVLLGKKPWNKLPVAQTCFLAGECQHYAVM